MNILVVDDFKTNRKLVRAMLESDDRVIYEAVDGLEALELLETTPIDAIISDILMPRMDGYRFCQALRHHRHLYDLPFIFYTSTYTSDSDAELARSVGGDRFLKKPVSAAILLAALEEICAPRPRRAAPIGLQPPEVEVLHHYNERLVHKLEHKNAELQKSRARLEAMIENVDGIVWEGHLATLTITFVSPQIERLLGFAPDKWLVPGFWESRVHPDDREMVKAKLLSWEDGTNLHFDFRMLDTASRPVWFHSATSRTGEADDPMLCGLLIDMTERKALEAQLFQAQKMEAVGRLAAGVAHDFNNLLSIIQLHLDVLLNSSKADACREGLEQIDEETRRAVRLTRQLLTLSRKNMARRVPIDLNELLGNLTSMLRRLLGEDIRLELTLDVAKPRALADAGLLEQVVLNLAVNARDAMPQGGTLRIRTQVMVRDGETVKDWVRLSVGDNGCGIPAELLPKIFEPFFTTKSADLGTGLGLSTVFSIAEQHQGAITVESREGQGTTFHFWLPRYHEAEAEVPASAAMVLPPPLGGGTEGILLVEDNETLREIVAAILGRLGYQVFEAGSGVDALEVWRKNQSKIALLFTDMVMPDGITGYELAARLSTESPELRVLLTSGHGFSELESGVELTHRLQFLQKPYSAAVLGESVRRCLDAA